MNEAEIDGARSWLFVPGDRPERFEKALVSGADVVIIDLEDAVARPSKDRARESAVHAIRKDGRFAVRVGAVGSDDGRRDLDALIRSGVRPAAVVVAKAEDPVPVSEAGRLLGAPVVALVESAIGVEMAGALAAEPSVARLALGAVDLSLDLDATPDDDVLASVRLRLVIASRVAGIAPPIDSPSLEVADLDVVAAQARTARRFGMGGKLCIHPAQVPVVAAALRPTPEEVAWASALLERSAGDGAAMLDGRMIDLPVLERARRVLARAEASR